MLVEHLGLGGLGGSRLRLVELSCGETLAIYDLFRSGEAESGSSGGYVSGVFSGPGRLINAEAGRTRHLRPLIMADGSIVVWSRRDNSPRLEVLCFDSQLAPLWARIVEVGAARSDPGSFGNSFLVDAWNELFCFQKDYFGDARTQQGWVTKVDLETGELGQPMSLPNNSIPLSGVAAPDGSILFLAAGQRGGDKKAGQGGG